MPYWARLANTSPYGCKKNEPLLH